MSETAEKTKYVELKRMSQRQERVGVEESQKLQTIIPASQQTTQETDRDHHTALVHSDNVSFIAADVCHNLTTIIAIAVTDVVVLFTTYCIFRLFHKTEAVVFIKN